MPGFASIGHLSETVGSERFGTMYRSYDAEARNFQGDDILPVDLAMNARSYGIDVIEVAEGAGAIDDLKAAVATAKASDRTTAPWPTPSTPWPNSCATKPATSCSTSPAAPR